MSMTENHAQASPHTTSPLFIEDDGGRAAAGFRGTTRDCVTRAIAIATGMPYHHVYTTLHQRALDDRAYMARLQKQYGTQARRHATPRTGAAKQVYEPWLRELGWEWTPTMQIGSGCTVHLRADELPAGRLIVRLTRHLAAVIDGVLHDLYDCSRDGTRCVYGYWTRGSRSDYGDDDV